jgi:hypothetical protein
MALAKDREAPETVFDFMASILSVPKEAIRKAEDKRLKRPLKEAQLATKTRQ